MRVREIISENNIDEGVLQKLFGKAASIGAQGVRKAVSKSPEEIKFAQDVSTIKKGAGLISNKAAGFMQVLKNIGLVYPFITYYKNMSAAEDNLKSGKWDQERFDEEKRIQIGMVTATLVTGLVGNYVLKKVESLLKVVKFLPVVGGPTAAIIGGVSNTAQVALLYELNTVEGRTILANLFTVGVIEGAGDIIGNQIGNLKTLAAKASEKSSDLPNITTPDNKSSQSVTQGNKPTPQQKPVQSQPQSAPSTKAGTYYSDTFDIGPDGQLKFKGDDD